MISYPLFSKKHDLGILNHDFIFLKCSTWPISVYFVKENMSFYILHKWTRARGEEIVVPCEMIILKNY